MCMKYEYSHLYNYTCINVPWNPLEVICISPFSENEKSLYIDKAGCNIFEVGPIFRRGYPNKNIPTKNYDHQLSDHYGNGRCFNTFQTYQTFTKR